MTQGQNKKGTSFRLSPTALELIGRLTGKLGLSQAGVIEMAVRKLAQTEGIQMEEQTTDGR